MAGDVGFEPLGLSNIDDVGIDLYCQTDVNIDVVKQTSKR